MSELKPIPFDSDGLRGPLTFKHGFLNLTGYSDLTFDRITFSECGQIFGFASKRIRFIECKCEKLHPDAIIQCELGPGNDDWEFDGCEFSEMPNAIYTRNGVGPSANHLMVYRCDFHDIATGKWAVEKDGHSIGIQGGVNHQIAWNKIRNVGGTAICAWASMNQDLCNLNFFCNDIDGVKANPGASGSGIEISSSYEVEKNLPKKGSRVGNLLLRNYVSNVEGNGFRYACAVDPLYANDGNVYSGCADGEVYIFNPFDEVPN